MASDDLFAPLFVPAGLRDAVSGRAWLQALLDAERALAAAEARAGVIPRAAAEAIGACCRAERFDVAAIGEDSRRVGNAAEPVARALADAVGGEAGRYVHWGATSQDMLDTAAMLVSRGALELVLAHLDGLAGGCAVLAGTHRSTPMAGRTLLQQALPTTFGLKAAGWLVGVLDARRGLARVRSERLAVELGGAVGTLASLGEQGPEVLRLYAEELGLPEPVIPWHTARARIAELGAALDIAAGAAGKIALDVTLLAQTEVGEVAESSAGGRGGSSTMPHKRNPLGSVLVLACARQAHAAAGVLSAGLAQEHERASGAWHAEWRALGEALALAGGAAALAHEVVEGLEVDTDRMHENLQRTGGLILAERVSLLLAGKIGRLEAHDLVRDAARRAGQSGLPFRDVLLSEPRVLSIVATADLDDALDPAGYLGSAGVFVDRALARYRQQLANQEGE